MDLEQIKIGYQGMQGSNSEEAAQVMAQKLGFKKPAFIPLISSQNVVDKLKKKEIDYGVMAVRNSLGGMVTETAVAIKNVKMQVVETTSLNIHHCLFKKNEEVSDSSLKKVVSHIQALRQTEKTRKKYFPHLEARETEDTAIGAKRLAEGSLDPETAVICRKNAGEAFGLKLVAENIEDDPSNQTEFKLFKLI